MPGHHQQLTLNMEWHRYVSVSPAPEKAASSTASAARRGPASCGWLYQATRPRMPAAGRLKLSRSQAKLDSQKAVGGAPETICRCFELFSCSLQTRVGF